ncbi:MAG: hypothetical protein HYU67_07310 [Flavobacteriia bacterium]|nr:hypothetical protein [Flavobacteriia bacterium]
MKNSLTLFFLNFLFIGLGQQAIIKGFAPKYIGQKIEILQIEDYLSSKEKTIFSGIVSNDSTFYAEIPIENTQKIIIRSKNNTGQMYVQKGAKYFIYFPEKNKFDEYRPLGNQVEIAFQDLSEEDVNFKILSFDRWMNTFLGEYFYKKNIEKLEFLKKLDSFKLNVFQYYHKDTNFFFQTYVRYSIANLDDIQYLGHRNRFEKYDFYLDQYPVSYSNDVYMKYFNTFYKNICTKMAMEFSNKVYLGILKSSPTLMVNALGEEYTLKNKRLRELCLLKLLSDEYFSGEYPQTNILSVLDSMKHYAIYDEHKIIAGNLIQKLTELVQGSNAPDFELVSIQTKQVYTKKDFLNKHVYMQFVDFQIKESEKELELLVPMYEKYKKDVEFITLYKNENKLSPKGKELLDKLPWPTIPISDEFRVVKNYKIFSYPTYVLLDSYGYVVDFPALKPTPNSKYETIDKSFFYIKKWNEEQENK